VGTGGLSSSLPTLPPAISRSAITQGLSLLASTSGVAPRAIWRARLVAAEGELEAVGKMLDAVVDGDAGHGESPIT
jgi:hypothetical protein